MKLYVQRHADAGEQLPDPAADNDRPLSELGRQQAWWVGQVLREWEQQPIFIIASPLPRTSETAAIVAEVLGVPWQPVPELARHLNIYQLLSALARDEDMDGLYIVGHHDNLTPSLAAMNGVYAGPMSPIPDSQLATWPHGEVRKLKFDSSGYGWKEKWRLHPAPDQMTVSAEITQNLGI